MPYDDNFGEWEIEDEEDMEFYREVQRESVWKICAKCGKKVKLRPNYGICNECADKIERGMDF